MLGQSTPKIVEHISHPMQCDCSLIEDIADIVEVHHGALVLQACTMLKPGSTDRRNGNRRRGDNRHGRSVHAETLRP